MRRDAGFLLLLALPVAAALWGKAGPYRVSLKLGPGDEPYVSGFVPGYVSGGPVPTHWTRQRAKVRLPLRVEGGPLRVRYRFARVRPRGALIELSLDGAVVDRYRCGHCQWETREVRLSGAASTPLELGWRIGRADRRGPALRLDVVEVEAAAGARVRVRGLAGARAPLLVVVVGLLLRAAGWSRKRVILWVGPLAGVVAIGLLSDPWLTVRLCRGVPESLVLLGGAGVGLGRLAVARGRLASRDLALAFALSSLSFLVLAAGVNQPGYRYPDQRTHARLVDVVRQGGWDVLGDPVRTLWGEIHESVGDGPQRRAPSGLWVKQIGGSEAPMPYPLTLHALFAPWPLAGEELRAAMKLGGAALASLAPALVLLLARSTGTAPLGALLAAVAPVYAVRLSLAALPALFGHVLDLAFVVWLAPRLTGRAPWRWATGAALVAAAQLSYTAAVLNLPILLALVSLLVALGRGQDRDRLRMAWRVLTVGLVGSLLAFLVYYWHFFFPLLRLLWREAQGTPAAGVASGGESWGLLVVRRTDLFFGPLLPLLALWGAWRLRRHAGELPAAWLATYLVLLLLRARLPGMFRHSHEVLFVTPLLCWAGGDALWAGVRAGGWKRVTAGVLVGVLVLVGLAGRHEAFDRQVTVYRPGSAAGRTTPP